MGERGGGRRGERKRKRKRGERRDVRGVLEDGQELCQVLYAHVRQLVHWAALNERLARAIVLSEACSEGGGEAGQAGFVELERGVADDDNHVAVLVPKLGRSVLGGLGPLRLRHLRVRLHALAFVFLLDPLHVLVGRGLVGFLHVPVNKFPWGQEDLLNSRVSPRPRCSTH